MTDVQMKFSQAQGLAPCKPATVPLGCLLCPAEVCHFVRPPQQVRCRRALAHLSPRILPHFPPLLPAAGRPLTRQQSRAHQCLQTGELLCKMCQPGSALQRGLHPCALRRPAALLHPRAVHRAEYSRLTMATDPHKLHPRASGSALASKRARRNVTRLQARIDCTRH